MKLVDHFDRMPKYLQICASLREAIASGDLEPLATLPSEAQLVQMHGVARETVRQAMAVLREEGWIFTIQARGSFVQRREDWPEQPPA